MIDSLVDSDDTFYYIAGYTSGGAPYGVTSEEFGDLELDTEKIKVGGQRNESKNKEYS